eukprot:c16872_g1_i1 orf=122-1180(+)
MTMESEAGPSCPSSHTQAAALDEEEDAVKPLMVRIKRKRLQPPIESLWLEVSERPTKRLEAELLSFSLNESDIKSSDKAVESKSSRLLFHHLDTVTSFGREETTRVNSLLREFHNESGKERHRSWIKNKHGKLQTTSREKHRELASKARFEQVWRSRKGVTKQDNLSEVFRLYDIVRVDMEADILKKHEREAENRLLQDFLPLLKEHLPTVAAEVESSTTSSVMEEVCADEYVYDVYALGEDADGGEADMLDYPMIQVIDDEDFRWGSSSESEYDSEDSNDENNPLNDYPEEEEDSECSLDAETDNSLSGSEVDDKKKSVQSDVSEEYGSDVFEGSEENWDSAGYDSAGEWR